MKIPWLTVFGVIVVPVLHNPCRVFGIFVVTHMLSGLEKGAMAHHKIKLFALEEETDPGEMIGRVACRSDESYQEEFMLRLEDSGCVEWPFVVPFREFMVRIEDSGCMEWPFVVPFAIILIIGIWI